MTISVCGVYCGGPCLSRHLLAAQGEAPFFGKVRHAQGAPTTGAPFFCFIYRSNVMRNPQFSSLFKFGKIMSKVSPHSTLFIIVMNARIHLKIGGFSRSDRHVARRPPSLPIG
ncbi:MULTISPECIES: hypothetical protein [Burkholderia]|uniref:hypothetical protein n=1 Tax=Burkholderia TaxID=32008 RepID=UPI0011AFC538|nr:MULTISPECIES: hypothetical protein [unclassified Burkholderia]